MARQLTIVASRVIAAWSYLPSYRWGMVVKQDIDEAFALVYKQRLVVGFSAGGDSFGCRGGRALAGANDHTADSRGGARDRTSCFW